MEDMEKKLAFLLATSPCISLAGTYGTYARAVRDLTNNGVVVREKGEWVKHWCENDLIGHEYEDCPFCGCEILDTEKFWDAHFCPNCGADMRKGENG